MRRASDLDNEGNQYVRSRCRAGFQTIVACPCEKSTTSKPPIVHKSVDNASRKLCGVHIYFTDPFRAHPPVATRTFAFAQGRTGSWVGGWLVLGADASSCTRQACVQCQFATGRDKPHGPRVDPNVFTVFQVASWHRLYNADWLLALVGTN